MVKIGYDPLIIWYSCNMDKPTYLLEMSPLVVITCHVPTFLTKITQQCCCCTFFSPQLYICNQLAPLQVQGHIFLWLANDIMHNYLDFPFILVHPFLPIEEHRLAKHFSFEKWRIFQLWHPQLLVPHVRGTHSHPLGIIIIVVNMPHSLCEHITRNPNVV